MAALIKYTLFNPVITGPLLYIFTVAPQEIQQPILQAIEPHVSYIVLERTVIALKWLFALGFASMLNSFFSELAQNNFRWKSEQHKYDWPKEIAVVTGAGSGFGRLISEGFASQGISVMALDIHDSLPAAMQSNKKIHYYKCDITSVDAVNATADTIRSEFGNPSILINNAGIAFEGNILQATPSQVRRIFDVNTISHYFTVNAFLPSMIAQHKGHIVTLASMASFISGPSMVSYCMTKASALAFHEGLAAELRNKKTGFNAPEVKLTIVHPTWAATPMIAPHRSTIDRSGMAVIEPQIVADAVVKQVMSGRGRQILLAPGVEPLATVRSWPSWLSGGLGMIAGETLFFTCDLWKDLLT